MAGPSPNLNREVLGHTTCPDNVTALLPKDVPGNLEARYTHSNLQGHRATRPRPWHPLPTLCFP